MVYNATMATQFQTMDVPALVQFKPDLLANLIHKKKVYVIILKTY